MKKLTLSLVAAGLAASSLGAYAALPTGAAPFQVVVPNLKGGMEFTLEGLYVQPTNSDLGYSVDPSLAFNGNGDPTGLNVNTANIKPDHDFGFRAGLGYIFPNSGNDVQVAWTHFDHDYTDSTVHAKLFPTDPDAGETRTDTGNVSFKYDAIDLDVGQYISFGTRLQTRLFAGLRGVQVKSNSNTQSVDSSNPVPSESFSYATASTSKFTGVGPRVGFDTNYHVGDCFGVVAHFATALLVGSVDESTTNLTVTGTQVGEDGPVTKTFAVSPKTDSETRVVPAIDAKLGVDYTISFPNKTSSMSIEAGYQVTEYFDVISRAPIVPTTSKNSNLGFSGPYLSLNFKI